MVKPGGTGRPALVISASPAPLPPSTSFILPLPSALPPPKKYTYLMSVLEGTSISVSGSVVVAIINPLRFGGFLGFGHDFRKIGDGGEFLEQGLQQRQPVRPHLRVLGHDHHLVEETVDRGAQSGDLQQRLFVLALGAQCFDPFGGGRNLSGQFLLRFLLQQARLDLRRCFPARFPGLAEDVLHALERDGDVFDIGGRAYSGDRLSPGQRVDALARAEAVARVRPSADIEYISVAFKRMKNILRQAREAGREAASKVEPSLLQEEPEKELAAQVPATAKRVEALRAEREYEKALLEVARLRPAIDRFFDKVMVMAEDAQVRANRLALLQTLLQEFSTIADFSEIVTETKEPSKP